MLVNCPFLAPSLRRGLARWHCYEADPYADHDAVEAGVFEAGAWSAEQVRARRAAGLGVCEVIALERGMDRFSEMRVLQWPHWALKLLYAPVGVMFGKFTPSDRRTDRFGRPVTPPPVALLAVRPALATLDPILLPSAPRLRRAIATSVDDGREVFAAVPGARDAAHAWPVVRAWSDQKRADP
ncbi:hypothetical protein [Streptomyces lydicus]|uniref:hypothetical protein n=1 Tax=Streptomyces lydicus TaxID=47763 RepID=UPI00370027C2